MGLTEIVHEEANVDNAGLKRGCFEQSYSVYLALHGSQFVVLPVKSSLLFFDLQKVSQASRHFTYSGVRGTPHSLGMYRFVVFDASAALIRFTSGSPPSLECLRIEITVWTLFSSSDLVKAATFP